MVKVKVILLFDCLMSVVQMMAIHHNFTISDLIEILNTHICVSYFSTVGSGK